MVLSDGLCGKSKSFSDAAAFSLFTTTNFDCTREYIYKYIIYKIKNKKRRKSFARLFEDLNFLKLLRRSLWNFHATLRSNARVLFIFSKLCNKYFKIRITRCIQVDVIRNGKFTIKVPGGWSRVKRRRRRGGGGTE